MRARALFREIAVAAWECADPGMQFDTTIYSLAHRAEHRPYRRLEPVQRVLSPQQLACNCALFLIFVLQLHPTDTFDVEGFLPDRPGDIYLTTDPVGNADYPTRKIGDITLDFRQIGIGYANLGAMLMSLGLSTTQMPGERWRLRSRRS